MIPYYPLSNGYSWDELSEKHFQKEDFRVLEKEVLLASTTMTKVIVLGATGLLGTSLVPSLKSRGYLVMTQSRDKNTDLNLDPLNLESVFSMLVKHRPDVLINLIAVTNVDECESNPKYAMRVNTGVVEVIANGIKNMEAMIGSAPHLIHISTDQIYDGQGPHKESEINPINIYAKSKYNGELIAQEVSATILRTNFYGHSRCKGRISFTDWIVNNLREKSPITVFEDVKFSAVHLDTLSNIIAHFIKHRPSGVFNIGTRDGISKANFALSLAGKLNLPSGQLKVGKLADAGLKAFRPFDMTMDVRKLEATLRLTCPTISSEIEYTVMEYKNERV